MRVRSRCRHSTCKKNVTPWLAPTRELTVCIPSLDVPHSDDFIATTTDNECIGLTPSLRCKIVTSFSRKQLCSRLVLASVAGGTKVIFVKPQRRPQHRRDILLLLVLRDVQSVDAKTKGFNIAFPLFSTVIVPRRPDKVATSRNETDSPDTCFVPHKGAREDTRLGAEDMNLGTRKAYDDPIRIQCERCDDAIVRVGNGDTMGLKQQTTLAPVRHGDVRYSEMGAVRKVLFPDREDVLSFPGDRTATIVAVVVVVAMHSTHAPPHVFFRHQFVPVFADHRGAHKRRGIVDEAENVQRQLGGQPKEEVSFQQGRDGRRDEQKLGWRARDQDGGKDLPSERRVVGVDKVAAGKTQGVAAGDGAGGRSRRWGRFDGHVDDGATRFAMVHVVAGGVHG